MSLEALRDEFAAAALLGLLAGRLSSTTAVNPFQNNSGEEWARWAYAYADAMMLVRRKICPVCGTLAAPDYLHTSGCTYGYQVDNDAPVGL